MKKSAYLEAAILPKIESRLARDQRERHTTKLGDTHLPLCRPIPRCQVDGCWGHNDSGTASHDRKNHFFETFGQNKYLMLG